MTIHPILRLLFRQPHLLIDHLHAYVRLAGEETSKVTSTLALQAGLYVGAAMLLMLGLLLTGVALLLLAATPSVDHTTWGLIAVPATPLVIGVVMVMIGKSKSVAKPFYELKGQIDADLAMLRESA